MTDCTHDLAERETAVYADGMCPLCLQRELKEAREALCDCLDMMARHTWMSRDQPRIAKARAMLARFDAALAALRQSSRS